MLTSKLQKIIVAALEDAKAEAIICLDVSKLTSITERMIICTGRSTRHVKSIAEHVSQEAKKELLRPLGVEGIDSAEWVIVDLDNVIVHVMLPATRSYYDLEGLWQGASS